MLWEAWKQPSKPDHGKDEPSEMETLAAHLKLGNGFQFRNVQVRHRMFLETSARDSTTPNHSRLSCLLARRPLLSTSGHLY